MYKNFENEILNFSHVSSNFPHFLFLKWPWPRWWPWPWGTKFSHNIFSHVSHMCAWIEPNLGIFSWSKSLRKSKGHDLDLWPWKQKKRPYSIKLWCIMYLNTKFNGYILKTVDVANLYITLLQRRKKLQWPLVTLTFEIWSPKKSVQSRVCAWHLCQKWSWSDYWSRRSSRTHTHTDTQRTYGYYSIDSNVHL